jgi:SEC-C motif-containing protein
MSCYCGSDLEFEDCCQPFLNGIKKPQTAEELMRSRYSAYVTANVDYLLRTVHPSTRKFHERESIEKWAKSSRWQKLEVIATTEGNAKDKKGMVEFKAYYLDEDQQLQIHHEHSNFLKELGKWFFVDGKVIESVE